MKEFIEKFKQTSYYSRLFNTEIIGIYLLGSRCTDIVDERSDYDITIITLNGEGIVDASKHEYLIYHGKKVHWYYRSLKDLYGTDDSYEHGNGYVGAMLTRNICKDVTIYENPKYSEQLQELHSNKFKISNSAIFRLYNELEEYINDVISEKEILEKHYTKFLSHLCLASYYLSNEEPDKDFLRSIKRIKWQPVSEEYKQLAVKRLEVLKQEIKNVHQQI